MKTYLLLFVVTLIILPGCNEEPETKKVEFHVQTEFEDDLVEIFIDDTQLVLSEKVTTSPILGVDLNAIKAIDVSRGEHRIRITVNGAKELNTTIRVDSDLFVGIRYDEQLNQISITQSLTAFLYM